MVEFTFLMIPMLSMLFVLVDTAWAVFVQASIQRAARLGVRSGVTLTAADMVGSACLTDTVKGIVQSKSFGFLNGSSGLSKIKVNYYLPPAPNSNSAATDVSAQANGDVGGNIIKITVQSFSLRSLLPRIFWGNTAWVDNSAYVFSVYAADVIEPSTNPPCIGTAP